MKIPASRLSGHLQKPLLPCYLVSGDEPLLVAEAMDAIRAAAREQGFDSRDLYIQLAGFDWDELIRSAGELSLFASRRIVELRLPTGKPGREGSAAIAELAGKADDDLLVVVQAPKLDRNSSGSKWVKALEARGALVQVWPVGPRELPGWINTRMQSADLKPDREAVRLIADRVEGNLLAAEQEIEKLRLILGAGPVTAEDIERAVANSSRYDVFQLVDAAIGGDAPRALRMLEGLRAEGVSEVVVMWALTRDIRVLAQLADAIDAGENPGGVMKRLRVWDKRQNMMRSCIGRHRRQDFHTMIKLCGEADAAAKGQRDGDAWLKATNLVWRLAGQRKAA